MGVVETPPPEETTVQKSAPSCAGDFSRDGYCCHHQILTWCAGKNFVIVITF